MKRIVDVMGALFVLALTWPVMLAAALCIKLDSAGPVIFRQTRLGLDGGQFAMYKFRSMVADAERRGGYSTATGDPRITRVGSFIRRTSIDELPQVFNVLKGDMSIVGPRPDVPGQRSLYTDDDWRARCSVRPGITGLAQALVRSNASRGQRLELDLRYVGESSLWLDLKIIGWTVARLTGKGSN